jgi:hypothetical protein
VSDFGVQFQIMAGEAEGLIYLILRRRGVIYEPRNLHVSYLCTKRDACGAPIIHVAGEILKTTSKLHVTFFCYRQFACDIMYHKNFACNIS